MGFRRKGREYALQLLFQMDVDREGARAPSVPFDAFWAERKALPEVRSFAEALVRGVEAQLASIDGILRKHTRHWSLERMAAVDRNVLRLAVYELLYLDDVPPRVALNEAIEIAKKYGSEESGGFVNGVLDNVLRTEPGLDGKREASGQAHASDSRR